MSFLAKFCGEGPSGCENFKESLHVLGFYCIFMNKFLKFSRKGPFLLVLLSYHNFGGFY